ncbi:hypothetical protein NMY22_g8674 [Coprinellus aureogranulatus]|nr:hypothetical protein NMY22_g8674 [Coprinellus aureogranulatus]
MAPWQLEMEALDQGRLSRIVMFHGCQWAGRRVRCQGRTWLVRRRMSQLGGDMLPSVSGKGSGVLGDTIPERVGSSSDAGRDRDPNGITNRRRFAQEEDFATYSTRSSHSTRAQSSSFKPRTSSASDAARAIEQAKRIRKRRELESAQNRVVSSPRGAGTASPASSPDRRSKGAPQTATSRHSHEPSSSPESLKSVNPGAAEPLSLFRRPIPTYDYVEPLPSQMQAHHPPLASSALSPDRSDKPGLLPGQKKGHHNLQEVRVQPPSPEDEFKDVLSSIEIIKATQGSSQDQLGDHTLSHLNRTLSNVIGKKNTYRCLLSLTDSKAQMMLDVLQMVLDHGSAAAISNNRRSMLKALLRLSVSTSLYPRCLHLSHQVQKSEEPVDEGSFGDVYRGRIAKREVAIKVFKVNKRTDLSKLMKTIWREAILWCQLYHANVLPCYGVHQLSSESHRIGLVSPWIESGNVIDYLHHNPSATRLLLLSDIASGIHYLHENKIVHGDLKGVSTKPRMCFVPLLTTKPPSVLEFTQANILVSSSGRACLADFGLSTLSDPALLGWTSIRTTAAKAAGTARWQAPELLDPDDDAEIKITPKSDVYSYGCVCYESLKIMTGNLPFYHIKNNLAGLIHVREGAQPRKPSPEDPAFQKFGLTEDIWDFMVTCWNQDPAERPTAQDICSNSLLTSVVDRRPPQQWGEASASEFRRWAVPSQG